MSNVKTMGETININSFVKQSSCFSLDKYPLILQKPKRVKSPIAWVEHIPFAFFAIEILKPQILVELGVHTGNSYSAFCQAVSTINTGTSCYGVDTWKGDEHAEFYDDSIFQELNEYNTNNYSAFSSLVRGTFDVALNYFSDKSVDLLHIDGFHTYEAVKHDFETWLPKMSERGVILMHDTCVRVNNFGVWKLFEELKNKYQTLEFIHGHGLGIVVVGNKVSSEFLEFVQLANNNDFYLSIFAKLGKSITEEYELLILKNNSDNLADQMNQAKENAILKEKEFFENTLLKEKEFFENTLLKEKELFEIKQGELKQQIIILEDKLCELELKQAEQDRLYSSYKQELEIINKSIFWKISKSLSRLMKN